MTEVYSWDVLPDEASSIVFAFRKAEDWGILAYLVEVDNTSISQIRDEFEFRTHVIEESVHRLDRAELARVDGTQCEATDLGERFWNTITEEFKNG